MSFVDIDIDVTGAEKEFCLRSHLRRNVADASFHVFETTYRDSGDLDKAVTAAIFNEAMLDLIMLGMEADGYDVSDIAKSLNP